MSKLLGIHLGKLNWARFVYAKLLLAVLYPVVWGGCSLHQPSQQQHLGDLGYFKFRAPDDHMRGVVIGAPHGSAEPATGEYAKWISDQTRKPDSLGLAKKSLHFELPLHSTLGSQRLRGAYGDILMLLPAEVGPRPFDMKTALNEDLDEDRHVR